MKYFLTIAASDNSGGAGILQDIKVASQLGYWGLSAITGLTVQNFNQLNSIYPVSAGILSEQIEMNLKSFNVRNVKIGAICSEENILAISKVLQYYQLHNIVLDPVFAPTRGISFIGETSIQLFKEQLLPYVHIVTPNKNELSLLSGTTIVDFEQGIAEAIKLSKQFGCIVYLKGGHFNGTKIKEALVDKVDVFIFEKEKLTLTYSHGTGCVFSSALSCFLGDGLPVEVACRDATTFVNKYFMLSK